jgi:hypothetical protein
VGAYTDVFEACARIRLDPDVDTPVPLRAELYQRYHAAYRDLYSATAPVMHRLAALSEQDPGDGGP